MSELAARIATLLTPFVPYLLDAAKQAGSEFVARVAEPAGQAAWQAAQTLWTRCRGWLTGDPKVRGALALVEDDPDEPAFATSLEKAVDKYLQAHPDTARDIDEAMREPGFVQLVRASGKATIRGVEQRGSGSAGRQEVAAADEATIENVRQGLFVDDGE